jgi:hypothetical protein
MKTFQDVLKEKIEYYGKTEAAYEFAAEEYANILVRSIMVDSYISGFKSAIDSLQNAYDTIVKRQEDSEQK